MSRQNHFPLVNRMREISVTVRVDFDELIDACDWVSAGASIDVQAYINRLDGRIYWQGEGVDEDPPEDAGDDDAWIAVPNRNELDLGRDLALRFVEEHLPGSYAKVDGFFHSRGAYAKFKSLLDSAGQLQTWYAYERVAQREGLTRWCLDNGFVASGESVHK